ncbi:membrane-anchored ubiquitin-fold protein 3-like isoform X2 [Macadamia integrifolia]|uniref:membrane-anchored ubiquitin-fold protein 3-like isoform X2 n=1 Tax=Macadamia integrifolia TaxID=60698 RepID=UPI001C4E34BE|nr:membrane-anchored ubiquitin-fold protein 3-like isoform X2 [Macadamia integrifolia]
MIRSCIQHFNIFSTVPEIPIRTPPKDEENLYSLNLWRRHFLSFFRVSVITSLFEFGVQLSTLTIKEDKENGPRTVSDLKLINAGKILENNRTLAQCRVPVQEIAGGVTTMHVVVRPPLSDKNGGLIHSVGGAEDVWKICLDFSVDWNCNGFQSCVLLG